MNEFDGRTNGFPAAVETRSMVKNYGDVEAVRGDRCWLHAASGEGFAWAGNFRKL